MSAINDTMRYKISLMTRERLQETQAKFSNLCSLPLVVGAIDRMCVSISKFQFSVVDYFYFKTSGYSMNCQAVVDSNKRFLDLYMGMFESINDSCMLH